tara:strand:- start:2035 stop:3216 length:1182 start_codon:yes stop_codon:yes gene_type:complete
MTMERGAGRLGRIRRAASVAAASPGRTALRAGAIGGNIATFGASGFLGKTLMGIKKDISSPNGGFFKTLSKNKAFLGINFGVGSLLKQSQVFTGIIGSILQIIGAMVDAFIAPFIVPLFVPLAKKAGSFIPKIQKYSQQLAEKWVPRIQEAFQNLTGGKGPFLERLKEFIFGFLDGVPEFLNDVFAGMGFDEFGASVERYSQMVANVFKALYNIIFDLIIPGFDKIGVLIGNVIGGFNDLGNAFEYVIALTREAFGKFQLGIENLLDIVKLGRMSDTEEAMLQSDIERFGATRDEIGTAMSLSRQIRNMEFTDEANAAMKNRYGIDARTVHSGETRGLLQEGFTQSEIQNMIQALFMDTMKTGGNVNFKFGQEGGMFNNFGSLMSAGFSSNGK